MRTRSPSPGSAGSFQRLVRMGTCAMMSLPLHFLQSRIGRVRFRANAPAVRSRGGRVVAVLQRDQAAQRDDCFRAGASDLLFMPLPKEQFVSRLASSVALSYVVEPGVSAAVQIGARGNLVPLAQATIT